MDDRQRRLRIERMRREKARQIRRRRRMRRMMARSILALLVFVVLFLGVSGVRKLMGGGGSKSAELTGQEKETAVTESKDGAAATKETAEETKQNKSGTDEKTDAESSSEGSGGSAQSVALAASTKLNYTAPGWQMDDKGWWYADSDTTFLKNGWKTVDGQKYYFNAEGYMQTGWVNIDNKGCFFDKDGVYDPDKEQKLIALTFDDGPGPYTNDLLDVLEKNNAHATFFMLGEQIAEYGEKVLPRMEALGCELGNHSYDHKNMKELTLDEVDQEFSSTDEQIAKYTSVQGATIARTPYGSQNQQITDTIAKPCIYWSLDTLDWKTKDVDSNIEAVMNHAQDGEIVLMHDIWPTSVEACKTIVPRLIEEGYQLVTISELAAAKGVTMEPGVTYYDFYSKESATKGSDGSEDDKASNSYLDDYDESQ